MSRTSGFVVRSHKKEKENVKEKDVAPFVPLDQRWMFEESELNGPDIWNKTWCPKAIHHVNTEKTWYIVDATDKILGRLASTIAIYIRGKNLATYTPSVDMGAFVMVVNGEKVAVSEKNRTQKLYRRHSGRPGGMTVETFDQPELVSRVKNQIHHDAKDLVFDGGFEVPKTTTTGFDAPEINAFGQSYRGFMEVILQNNDTKMQSYHMSGLRLGNELLNISAAISVEFFYHFGIDLIFGLN